MGHVVTYTPMAPGNYLIAIKYGGPQHIVGSPFKAKVTGPRLSGGHSLHETSTVLVETVTKSSSSRGSSYSSIPKFSSDASKVVTRGPGLSQGFMGQKNSFTVDCSKAGTNMMMVGVHGPKTPCEEVYVKHMGNRVYNVTYTVKEKGDYILIVKWGDETAMVGKTQPSPSSSLCSCCIPLQTLHFPANPCLEEGPMSASSPPAFTFLAAGEGSK
uniref:Uncharacterized protein n=1 Tax=Theropithecus gelada TaxID=9565 RepID=A0A8D2FXB5_THEGE